MSAAVRTIALIAGLALAVCSAAAAPYQRIAPQSSISVSAVQMGVAMPASLKPVSGHVSFDPAAVAHARLELSVATATIDSGSADNDALLRGADWLDARTYPQAGFSATAFVPAGPQRWWVIGKLTLKGQTLPLKVLATATPSGELLALDADAQLDRKTWKLGTGEWSDPAVVAATIAVHIHLVLARH